MIEKLDAPFISGNYGCGGPTHADIIDKINELVEAVNQLERELEKWKER